MFATSMSQNMPITLPATVSRRCVERPILQILFSQSSEIAEPAEEDDDDDADFYDADFWEANEIKDIHEM